MRVKIVGELVDRMVLTDKLVVKAKVYDKTYAKAEVRKFFINFDEATKVESPVILEHLSVSSGILIRIQGRLLKSEGFNHEVIQAEYIKVI